MNAGLRYALTAAIVLLAGCSDDDSAAVSTDEVLVAPSSSSSSASSESSASDATDGLPLRVDLIAPAIAALEDELGGPQRYFEINATTALVNLFVADETSGQVVPYTYADGALTGEEPSDAQGNTFLAASLDVDPATVTAQVTAELPDSVQDAFVVEGGLDGAVRYSIVVTSVAGGQLVVVVAGDGAIVSVDTVG